MTLKEKILDELLKQVKLNFQGLVESASAANDLATNEEFKSESKYDTRSLEASYLAQGEAKRLEELKLEIQLLEDIDLSESPKSIRIGSLVELKHRNHQKKYFLTPTAGGTLLSIDQEVILVVSVFSPIGDAMLGLKVGDTFEVETPQEVREYEVCQLL